MARIATYPSVSRPPTPPTEEDYRAAVVAEGERWLGVKGRTPECDLLFEDAAPCYVQKSASGKHYCGIGVLYCLRKALLTDALWRDVVGFIGPVLGWTTIKNPKPADVCFVDRASHHALVTGGDAEYIDTIDFNSGPTPGIVARHRRKRGATGVHYFPIDGLIAKAIARETANTNPAPPLDEDWDIEDTVP
jgi:hypothetical protein